MKDLFIDPGEHEELMTAAGVVQELVSSQDFFDTLGYSQRDRAIAKHTLAGVLENRIYEIHNSTVLYGGNNSGLVSIRRLSGIYEMTVSIMSRAQELNDELLKNLILFTIYPVTTGHPSSSLSLRLFPVKTPDEKIEPADVIRRTTTFNFILPDQDFDLSVPEQAKLDVIETDEGVAAILHRMYQEWYENDAGHFKSFFRPSTTYQFWQRFPAVATNNVLLRPYALSAKSTPEMVKSCFGESKYDLREI